ncbi:uncharacterized protein [Sinocyclocheilus grahami]|uniref:uncharacterized protein n=1 Tax=Sinocyclocheilus grahami TaxID=75366 RepID=UPI0007AD4AD4|nr:PREDICTED: uncharacterized protein LOC107579334 [Sinocyclocheilus grahami]
MESVGELCSPTGASSNILSLPGSCPWDEDEESLDLEGIKPKSSPIPRRRSSASSDDSLLPPSSSRRVSFADAFDINHGLEICEETATSWQESSQKTDIELSGSMQAMENDWNLIDFIDKEENVCCESVKREWETIDDVNSMLENMERLAKDSVNRDLENVEDNTSTESQIDDEMELYLNSLRNSQQSVFREGAMSGSYGKRPSLSRGRPLAMPSISESMDEDQPSSSLEDLTNIEYNMKLERATLPLVDGNERVIGRNVLWWKEFLSYDNMSRVTRYTFLLIVFLVIAYYYDFIACFALYILTVYWLFYQGEEEPLKSSQKGERGL